MVLRLPILKFFTDDSGKSLKLFGDGETRPVTFRLPEEHLRWLEEQAAASGGSVNQVVREIVVDLCTWFRMPEPIGRLLEDERREMRLDRRAYLQHILVKRFVQILDEGIFPDSAKRARKDLDAIAVIRGDSQGTPFAFRMAKDHLAWLQEQAEMYGLSSAGFLRLIIEDRANWFGLPPTIAARIAHDQVKAVADFREYIQSLLRRRYERVKERGYMDEAYSYRFPATSQYSTVPPKTRK